jgi:predicted DNA-binding transcriptional regulator YafY
LYIDSNVLTVAKLAERFNVDENTIRRDEKKAISELSVMIFGIDGLNDMSK